MALKLTLEIATPDSQTISDEVDMVTLPGAEGELGVYPQHVPLMTRIVGGEVTVRKDQEEYYLAVGDGFVEINFDRVSILTDMAIKAADIDEAQAEEAQRRAEARLQEKLSDEQAAATHAALAHSLVQLKVKRRHRSS